MNRAFTAREKTLLLVLVVLMLALGYFQLVFEPIQTEMDHYSTLTQQTQTTLDQYQAQLLQMKRMEALLEEMHLSGSYRPIPGPDNLQAITLQLHRILAQAQSFALEFGQPKAQGYVLARPVSLSFTALDTSQAYGILQALGESENTNELSQVHITWDRDRVTVSLQITYYEALS